MLAGLIFLVLAGPVAFLSAVLEEGVANFFADGQSSSTSSPPDVVVAPEDRVGWEILRQQRSTAMPVADYMPGDTSLKKAREAVENARTKPADGSQLPQLISDEVLGKWILPSRNKLNSKVASIGKGVIRGREDYIKSWLLV